MEPLTRGEAPILEQLDQPTRLLVLLAAAIARGRDPDLDQAAGAARAGGVPPQWVDELLLQSVLICGWPRALTGARACRQAGFPVSPGEDATDYRRYRDWIIRGEATCREVYGSTYPALRRNIQALHPALDAAMIVEGYGRVIGRPGLDLARRELCTVAQIAIQDARRQLRSHLQGALNSGAAPELVTRALELVQPDLRPEEWAEIWQLWERVRG